MCFLEAALVVTSACLARVWKQMTVTSCKEGAERRAPPGRSRVHWHRHTVENEPKTSNMWQVWHNICITWLNWARWSRSGHHALRHRQEKCCNSFHFSFCYLSCLSCTDALKNVSKWVNTDKQPWFDSFITDSRTFVSAHIHTPQDL